MEKTPLEAWIYDKITGGTSGAGQLTRGQIEDYQIRKLQETISWAKNESVFYRRQLAGSQPVVSLADLTEYPFTTADDIRQNPLHFLCVSQSEIDRIVTLQSSGTTGAPKRLFFSGDDQELTVDFFHYGMTTLVKPGDRVLILMPGESPGSVGDLLRTALARFGADGIVHGPVYDVAHTLDVIRQEPVDALVGIPTQVLALARYRDSVGRSVPLKLHSVLLSTDHVPDAIVRELQTAWGCQVFNHYGMTEMGLGGGVECQALAGYHLREADLFLEIINPDTGLPMPDGERGEVVFTTLTRRGMPLIRYRTGDISRFIPESCPCGTVLKRMDGVKNRMTGRIELSAGRFLTMADLDEALFVLDGLMDFQVNLTRDDNKDQLEIGIMAAAREEEVLLHKVRQAAAEVPVIKSAVAAGALTIAAIGAGPYKCFTNGTAKRSIRDLRDRDGTR
ncbi:MAG: AMP-binding protein [Thermincola sp.]|jgi:phenylacetate-coenzyme A ligase PaaK-like adenylate-forming protein|nr:AMP-binding protein [Thermincola sp.]MDT3702468.1 AMP-binding protein [Thermincola sp.]